MVAAESIKPQLVATKSFHYLGRRVCVRVRVFGVCAFVCMFGVCMFGVFMFGVCVCVCVCVYVCVCLIRACMGLNRFKIRSRAIPSIF